MNETFFLIPLLLSMVPSLNNPRPIISAKTFIFQRILKELFIFNFGRWDEAPSLRFLLCTAKPATAWRIILQIMGYKIYTYEIHSSYAARIENY
ncbi:unnamed protein product [Cuscuta campestris]|uniref:Uncharacterized protein n=1 Tax=Cuscuta campestris TaxID=132261 RepID=A0A484LAQ7_9ASTE|nr:unnamed protein product [Cuscuta campestris]